MQLKLFKVFGVILIGNGMTWMPFLIHVIASSIVGMSTSALFDLAAFVAFTSFAIIHPIIQGSLIPELRKYLVAAIKKIVPWQKLRASSSDETVRPCLKDVKCSLCCVEFLEAGLLIQAEEKFKA